MTELDLPPMQLIEPPEIDPWWGKITANPWDPGGFQRACTTCAEVDAPWTHANDWLPPDIDWSILSVPDVQGEVQEDSGGCAFVSGEPASDLRTIPPPPSPGSRMAAQPYEPADPSPPLPALQLIEDPDYHRLHDDVKHCFEYYWADFPWVIANGYPETGCAQPHVNPNNDDCNTLSSRSPQDVTVRHQLYPHAKLRAQQDIDDCLPVLRGPPGSVDDLMERQSLNELRECAFWLLKRNLDIVRWSACHVAAWAPQWTLGEPLAYRNRLPSREPPPGTLQGGFDPEPSPEFTWANKCNEVSGSPSYVNDLMQYLSGGIFDVIVVDRFLDGKQSTGCVINGANASAINRNEAIEYQVSYLLAVVLSGSSPSWTKWAAGMASANPTDRTCAAVRAASVILHELTHVFSSRPDMNCPWADHLRNGCLDPCFIVESCWQHAMSVRLPCILDSACCGGIITPDNFLLEVSQRPNYYHRCV